MPSSLTVPGDEVRLAVRDWGGVGRPIVLLHGLASSSRIFDLMAPALAGRCRVVAYDQRGHGGSGKPSSGYGFDHLVSDAAAVIRALKLRRPVVCGHSWGASVALELAVARPRNVAGIVLIDGGFVRMRDRLDWPTARTVLAPPPIAGTPVEEFRATIPTFARGAYPVSSQIEEIFLSLMRVDGDGRIRPRLSRANHMRILRAMWEEDPPALLGRSKIPTLILAARGRSGAEDPEFARSKKLAARTVRDIGDPVRLEWMEGIHDLPLQHPAALARRISRFVSSTPS